MRYRRSTRAAAGWATPPEAPAGAAARRRAAAPIDPLAAPAQGKPMEACMPPLALVISQLFHGLVLGGMLALVGSGLTIILGTLGLVNFAHGAFFAVGAYAGWLAFEWTGSYVAALALGALATCAI